jgi:hypothetical protein
MQCSQGSLAKREVAVIISALGSVWLEEGSSHIRRLMMQLVLTSQLSESASSCAVLECDGQQLQQLFRSFEN